MQKHEAQNLPNNESNFYERSKHDDETGRWFFTSLFKYSFLVWLFTYGEPDLLYAMIQFLTNYR